MPLPIALRPGIANTARLRDAILSLQPTAYWPLDDGSGPLRSLGQNWPATVTGSPTFGVAAPDPIGRGITWSGSGQYATTDTSVPVPASSVSLLAILRTTDSSAAQRAIVARGAANQYTWELQFNTAHKPKMIAYQAAGSTHCTATAATAANDGAWRLVIGTFDGTTAWVRHGWAGGYETASDGTLTSTWHKSSTAAVSLAARITTALFPGTVAHLAYWSDRVLTDAEARWLTSIAFGG